MKIMPNQLGDFHSGEMSTDELKEMIREVVEDTQGKKIKEIIINYDGLVEVILDDGHQIEIEIDWNEIILR